MAKTYQKHERCRCLTERISSVAVGQERPILADPPSRRPLQRLVRHLAKVLWEVILLLAPRPFPRPGIVSSRHLQFETGAPNQALCRVHHDDSIADHTDAINRSIGACRYTVHDRLDRIS